MAQYDGSVRINTEVNASQLMALENRMVKTANKIVSLRSKMDSLKNVKIPTQEYKAIESDIAKAETELGKLIEKQAQMQNEGKDSGAAWDRLNQRIQAAKDYIETARDEMQQLANEGKAFTLGQDTEQYKNLGQQLQYAENDLSAMTQRHDELIAKQNSVKTGYQKLGQTVKSVFSTTVNVIKKTVSAFSILGKGIKKAASFMTSFGKSTKSTNGSLNSGLKTILKYGLGIRSLYVLVNKFRTGVKEGFKNLAQVSDPVNKSLSSLKSALTQLKNSLATAFAPILTAIAPALITLINMASKAATAVGMLIAALTGQKTFTKATAVQEDYAESLKKTSSEAKKANKQLSGLDKLNNLTTQDKDKDSGDGGISPSDMFETVDISSKVKDFADMLKKAWEKANFTEIGKKIGEKLKAGLESIPWSKIESTAKKVGKSFATLINGFVEVPGLAYTVGKTIAEAINTGLIGLEEFGKWIHFDSIGKFIADEINGVLENIRWKKALSAAKLFGTGIATSLNNALTPKVFSNIGTTIGNLINTALTFAYNLLTTFDFLRFGTGISNMLNNALKELDEEKLGKTLGAGLRGVIQTAFGAITTFDFVGLGKKIGDSINGFFEEMGKVDKETGLTGWQELGQTLSTSITGILDTITTALSTVKWEEAGKAIAGFISSIEWGEILLKTGQLIINALWAAIKIAVSAFASDPLGITSAIAAIMAAWFTIGAFSLVASTLKTAFLGVLNNALLGATNALKTGGIKGLLQTKLGTLGAIAISLTIAIESIKWANKNWKEVFGKYSFDEIILALNEMFSDLFGEGALADAFTGVFTGLGAIFSGEYSFGEWINGFTELGGDLIDGLCKGIADAISGIGNWIKTNIFNPFVNGFKSLFGIHSPSTVMAKQGGFITSGLLNGLKNGITAVINWLKNLPGWFKEKFVSVYNSVKSAISGVKEWLIGIFSKAWDGIKAYWGAVGSFFKTVWGAIKSAFSNVVSWLKDIFKKAWDGIKAYWSGVGKFFSSVWGNIKSSFGSVGSWFKGKFSGAWTNIKNAFSGAKQFFSGVWKNITGVFGNITGWFKDKFSAAWTAVKNVFSKGGQIFSGIKEGILSGLKTVINGLISGINSIIKVPFDGLNKALGKLKSIDIAGLKPFDWMPTITVPQIPKLATGAVIPANKEFLAVLGDQKHGRNLEAPEDLIRKIFREETSKNNSGGGEITIKIPVEVEGRVLFELMKKFDLEEYQRTGKPSFQM